jgi:2-methylisocitrate lyase-like PEP mutase family enzyme
MKGVAFPVADLAAAGVRRISLGAALSRAAYGAMIAAAREIREHGTFSFVADAPAISDFAPYLIARR